MNVNKLVKTILRRYLFVAFASLTIFLVACAPKRTLIYESFNDNKFSRVKAPAKFQKSTTAELLKNGYLLIGYMDLKKNIRECYTSAKCKQISDRIPSRQELSIEAARRGGHIISLLEERRILKPIKKSYCVAMTSYHYWVKKQMVTGTRCVSYGYKTGFREVELSRALIWRYAPQRANASSNYLAIKKAVAYLAKKYKVNNKKRTLVKVSDIATARPRGRFFSDIARQSIGKSHKGYLKLWVLEKAIREGNVARILKIEKQLQREGLLGSGRKNALMSAIVFRKSKVARALIRAHYNIRYVDRDGRTAIIYAIHVGDFQTTKLLLNKGIKISYRDRKGYSLMAHAALGSNTNIIRYLKRRGLHVDSVNGKGVSPLMMAARNGNYKSSLVLVSLGANVNKKAKGNLTPLMFAAMRNHPGIIRYLVSRKARVNDRSKDRNTALIFAAGTGNYQAVKALVAVGAHINVKNRDGGSPLYFSLKRRKSSIAGFLIDKGAHLNFGLLSARNVLLFGISTNQSKLVQKLFNRGVKVQSQSISARVMRAAARYSGTKMINMLVKNGVNVNVVGSDGVSPLMTAAIYGNTKAVKALLRYKANAGLRNKRGHTAMMMATMRGKAQVVNVMRNAGVKD